MGTLPVPSLTVIVEHVNVLVEASVVVVAH